MFKRKILTVLVTTAVVGFGGYAINASAATDTGSASATIVTPLSVIENTAMNFGSISPDFDSPTTVDLDAAGAGASSADGAGIVGAAAQEGIFDVGGADLVYDITFPASVLLTGGGGADTMTVSGFVDDSGTNTGTISGGADQFSVGASLAVGANQPTGAVYTGSYVVTVAYQ